MYAAYMAETFKHYWYGAGLKLEQEFLFAENIILRPVQLNSKIHLLENRAETQRDYGFLCALADTISFELEITADTAKNAAMQAWNYQYILILLSIYKTCPIAWPFQCHSSAISDSDSKIIVSNIAGINRAFSTPVALTENDLNECKNLWSTFYNLISDKAFLHASSVAATNFIEPRASIRMASIWSGIEAILGFDQELTFRLSLASARLLEKAPQEREKRFRVIKKLYGLRSKCVHGSPTDREAVEAGVNDSLSLLRDLLLFFIGHGHLLSDSERDLLFLE